MKTKKAIVAITLFFYFLSPLTLLAKDSSLSPILQLLLLDNFKNSVISLDQLDFTLRTTCARYSFIDSGRYLGNGNRDDNLDSPAKIEVSLVDDQSNTVFKNIFEKTTPITTGFASFYNSSSCFAAKYPVNTSQDQTIRDIISNNVDLNVLLTCRYNNFDYSKNQKFEHFIPLKRRKAWLKTVDYQTDKNVLNNLLLHNSVLTDLHYKIYMASIIGGNNQEKSLDLADQFLEENFGESVFKETDWQTVAATNTSYGNLLQAENSPQSKHYRYLKFIANFYTDGNIETANELIAVQYGLYKVQNTNTCAHDLICGTFFPDKTSILTENYAFGSALANWTLAEQESNDSTGRILAIVQSTNPMDYSVKMTLTSTHAMGQPAARSVSQTESIDSPEDLDNLFLKIKSKELYGTCTAFGGCFASGYAGIFVCFRDGDHANLGCATGGSYYDSITINNAIGAIFKVESSDDMLIMDNIPSSSFNGTFSIKDLADQIPTVKANTSKIKYLEYGVAVGEATTIDSCLDCVATAEVDEIALVRLNRN